MFLLAFYIGWRFQTPTKEELDDAMGSRATKRQFEFINRGVMEFDVEALSIMQGLVNRRAPSRDPQLIKLVKRLLDPPPTEGTLTLSKGILATPQSQEVDALLSQKVSLVIWDRCHVRSVASHREEALRTALKVQIHCLNHPTYIYSMLT